MKWEDELATRLKDGTLKQIGFSEADARWTLKYYEENTRRR